MSTFQVEIVTPDSRVYEGPITALTAPGSEGRFQILQNHAPLISTLGNGELRLELESGESTSYNVEGGVLEVMNNKAIVLLERILEEEAQEE
ncbi:MAG: ATP synthase F1 subunit epsilon [Bacteroidia bacterium]